MAEYADIPYLGPPRWYGNWRTDKRYIAIHATANTATARGEASYATRRTDTTSSHYYVDHAELVQSLHTDLVAWHAGNDEGNTYAIAYEITGLNAWTRQQWLDRVAWGPLARQIVRDCRKHAINPVKLTVAQMQAGNVTGIVTHNDMRLAWAGTDHTDPGPNFPMDHLLAAIQRELTGDDDMTPEELFNAPIAGTPDNPGRTYRQAITDGWYNGHIRIPAALAEVKGMLVEVAKRVDISDAELAAIGEQAAAAVDEQAIAEGVLAGLGARSPEDVAAALRAVMTPEQARAVGAILATAE